MSTTATVTTKDGLFPPFRHESFNEIGREEAIDAVVGWIRGQSTAA